MGKALLNLAGIAIIVTICVIIWPPGWLWPEQANNIELLRILILALAGLGGFYGLILATRRQEKFERQVDNAQAQLFNDRLGRGVELLSNEKMTMRSAGVRILEDLSTTASQKQTGLIVDILMDFLNSNAAHKSRSAPTRIIIPGPSAANHTNRDERIDIENCFNSILKLKAEEIYVSNLDLRFLHLRFDSAKPVELDVRNSNLSSAYMELTGKGKLVLGSCNICNILFFNENFYSTDILICYGYRASFSELEKIKESNFQFSQLPRANFMKITFENVSFFHCKLDGAEFLDTTFHDVSFTSANLIAADFSGADFDGVQDLTQAQLNGIIYNKDKPPINLPNGLTLPTERAYFYNKERRPTIGMTFVPSDDKTLSGRLVGEVVDELLAEQDNAYSESLPPT
mgnify:CR=1 FL=1